MSDTAHQKISASHLARNAYVYVRQSTVRQVFENTESTERQYALRQEAVALGWTPDRVTVIDSDLGQSGASAADREGFQKLVAEVSMGRAGLVLGLEVSRLARNSTDWHRLLEICALTDTLILDEDGIYDPAYFNDRLLLGLKGTMSEAELHMLRARLRGGLLNKARRGELHVHLPIGYVYDPGGRVVLDPDTQVHESVKLLFDTFNRNGSAYGTVKYFGAQGLLFPMRMDSRSRRGELVWSKLSVNRAVNILHNPWYAGAYVYGRSRRRKQPEGRSRLERLPQEKWLALLKGAHPAFISWEEYERTELRLQAGAKGLGPDGKQAPPREGSALLQGRAVCGICGRRMQVHYRTRRKGAPVPDYFCGGGGREYTEPLCQSILGTEIDAAVGTLLVERVTPMALELALAVQDEIQCRLDEADRLRHRQVERAQYEADRARHRYMQVDPSNRLVAGSLEAEWNERLRALAHAEEEYQRQRAADRVTVDVDQRARILALAVDFPSLWTNPTTPPCERKRMLALLIEDVTLLKGHEVTAHVRFRGGATTTLTLPRPRTHNEMRITSPEAREHMNALLDELTDSQVADGLNARGLKTGAGANFDAESVKWVRFSAGLPSLKERLLAAGMLTRAQITATLGISRTTLARWRSDGRIDARVCNESGEWLYRLPPDVPPDHDDPDHVAAAPAMGSSTARGVV